LFTLTERSSLKKRKNLRDLMELYLLIINKYLNPTESKNITPEERDQYIEKGLSLFYFEQQR